ncbi:transmembrane protein 156 isoform X1 [Prionailurus iriomotensis]
MPAPPTRQPRCLTLVTLPGPEPFFRPEGSASCTGGSPKKIRYVIRLTKQVYKKANVLIHNEYYNREKIRTQTLPTANTCALSPQTKPCWESNHGQGLLGRS